jgi:pyruvate-formate lyase
MVSRQDPSLPYQQRIDALRATKLRHTALKVQQGGYFDTDDLGYIPWDQPIPFAPQPNHPSGRCYGMRSIGENFRAWLAVCPTYIDPQSSLAGAWITGGIPGVGGWRPEDRPTHLEPTFQEYNIVSPGIGAMGHLGPDMHIGLELGWGGLLRKIRSHRELNGPADTSFYDGEEALVLGVQTFVRRHVALAREMAAQEPQPVLAANLLSIAEMNAWLVERPPRTLREACQFLAWFQSLDKMYGGGGGTGQLDELLRPYYEADRAAGLEDDEAVIWHIASLIVNNPHYAQIGGPAPDGHDLTSPLSFLILEAVHRLRIPSNLAIRVHDGLDPTLLRRAVTYLFEDGTGPSYSCSKGLDEGYARNGTPLPLARMRAKVGCNWTALPGIEYPLQDVTRVCLVSPLLHALGDVVQDGAPEPTMDALWERYVHHLRCAVEAVQKGKDWHMAHQADNSPEIVLNLFCHGPIERGIDVSAGGVDIYDLAMDAVGLATVADSLAAIEQRVVVEQRLTWQNLARHLAHDFAGAEEVRLMLSRSARFGAGGTRGDTWAQRVAGLWTHLVRDIPTPQGYRTIPGLFSHGIVGLYGQGLGATPNGRHAGEPVSHSADPDPGFMPDGAAAPTAKSVAVAAMQCGWGNSVPLQIEFDRRLARDYGGVEAIEAYIRAHNAMGGTLVNINIVSKEQILEAHADPSTHPDLVVRVTGYSAYFSSLSPTYRQQVVDRILAEG